MHRTRASSHRVKMVATTTGPLMSPSLCASGVTNASDAEGYTPRVIGEATAVLGFFKALQHLGGMGTAGDRSSCASRV